MIFLGAIVNGVMVLAGSLLGILFRKWISEELNHFLMQVLGVCIVLVGLTGALEGNQVIITIVSMVLGAIIGFAVDFDRHLNRFGLWVQKKFGHQNGADDDNRFAAGFVSATLLICVGAMAIVGSLQSGTSGNHEVLLAKSVIDAIAVLIMSATMGIGVAFSAVPVLVYEGGMTLIASFLTKYLSNGMIAEMTSAGGLIIVLIGLNMMGLTKVKIANLILAPFFAILITAVLESIG